MQIHVVEENDTIDSIARRYNILQEYIIRDNSLTYPYELVIGQPLMIANPRMVHRVAQGDTIGSILEQYQITSSELLQNNPKLLEEQRIAPNDILIIDYDKKGDITTHGNVFPYIDTNALIKTLPFLTYLSVINYTAPEEGNLIEYLDDRHIVKLAIDYGVIPLMFLTTSSLSGEANIRAEFDILLSEEYQDEVITHVIRNIEEKGYYGVNMALQYVDLPNISYYERLVIKLATTLNRYNYILVVTINPNIQDMDINTRYDKVDYSLINTLAKQTIFINNSSLSSITTPGPVISLYDYEAFVQYIIQYINPSKVILGVPFIGYHWSLPYIAGFSDINYSSLTNISNFVKENNIKIEFDDISQTPYFNYLTYDQKESIVWYIDIRTIDYILGLVTKYQLSGIDIWNIVDFNYQYWGIISSQYNIVKLLPVIL